ncbi:12089_t:CDS:1, partial [Funneliformis geosporum]
LVPTKFQSLASCKSSINRFRPQRLFSALAIIPYYATTTIPTTICTLAILYVPMICKFEYQLYKQFYSNGLLKPTDHSFTAFITLLIGSIVLPVLVLVGDIVFMFVVLSAALGAIVMTVYGGFECGVEFCHRITMAVPETYWEMIFPSTSLEEKNTNWYLN